MAIAPHLEPDPFDKEIETMLANPEFVAKLDKRRGQVERGVAILHEHDEARRLVDLEQTE